MTASLHLRSVLRRHLACAIGLASLLLPSNLMACDDRCGHHQHATLHHQHAYRDYDWFSSSHHAVVRGRPRSVFVDPVGYAYPAIKYRDRAIGYTALPLETPNATQSDATQPKASTANPPANAPAARRSGRPRRPR